MSRHKPALILQTNLEKDKYNVSLYEQGATVHSYEEVPFSVAEINRISTEINRVFNKACELGRHSNGFCAQLKKLGGNLFQKILSPRIKEILSQAQHTDLQIIMDEDLVFIPWELLFDGQQFFCLKFNLGRGVKTRRPANSVKYRSVKKPARMLVMADPCGTLPSARREAVTIREQFPGNRPAMLISTKTKDITLNFIQRNLREYDVIHFAGHTKHHPTDRGKSGLVMKDGILTVEDLKHLNPQEPMPALIFSNSCQSAYDTADVYQSRPGEQVFGLADAFLLGGVRFFLGTLWKISDEDGGIFAREFYKYISEGSTIGSALRQSRLASCQKLGEDNMVWASYVLYGEPNRPIIADEHSFPGQQVIHRLAPKAPLIGAVLLFLISGILLFMNSSELSTANIEKKRATIRQKYETEGLGKTFDYIRQTWNSRSAKDQYLQNIFLADVYALSSDYGQSMEAAENALAAARQMRNKEKVAQAEFFLADKIREKGLHLAVFFPQQELPAGEFHKAIKLYEKQAAGQTDLSRQAYAYKGIGDIYKTRKEYPLTLEFYQKAIEALNKKRIISLQERVSLANMHIDMARLYLEGERNFDKAMDHLQHMGGLIRVSDPKGAITPFDRHVLLSKYQLLLQHLADTGFKNSSFYKKSETHYRQL